MWAFLTKCHLPSCFSFIPIILLILGKYFMQFYFQSCCLLWFSNLDFQVVQCISLWVYSQQCKIIEAIQLELMIQFPCFSFVSFLSVSIGIITISHPSCPHLTQSWELWFNPLCHSFLLMKSFISTKSCLSISKMYALILSSL